MVCTSDSSVNYICLHCTGGLWSPAMVAESKSIAKVVGSLSPWPNLTNAGKANKSGVNLGFLEVYSCKITLVIFFRI